jgi:hypothetical protein
MTRDEVVAAVGGPPGDYSDGQARSHLILGGYNGYESWLCRDAELLILFDERGEMVDAKITDPLVLPPPTLFERALHHLGIYQP